MEAFYVYLFMVGAVAAAVFEYGNRLVKVTAAPDLAFRGFKTNYLVVYSFMMGTRGRGEGHSVASAGPVDHSLMQTTSLSYLMPCAMRSWGLAAGAVRVRPV